jgi:hypothetical protein
MQEVHESHDGEIRVQTRLLPELANSGSSIRLSRLDLAGGWPPLAVLVPGAFPQKEQEQIPSTDEDVDVTDRGGFDLHHPQFDRALTVIMPFAGEVVRRRD